MTRPISEELDELAEDFALLGDWEERYRYVIELGKGLAPLPEAERTDANKVRGCASQVWLSVHRRPDGRLEFLGDSDAHIVKGLVAILLKLYSGRTPEEIAAFDAKSAVERLGLSEALSSQRANGLVSMVERIRAEARAATFPLGGSVSEADEGGRRIFAPPPALRATSPKGEDRED